MEKKEMERKKFKSLSTALTGIFICVSVANLPGQSGGTFEIRQSVVANGGGASSGGTFSVTGTSGQTTANRSGGPPYSLQSGFWQGDLAASAALVTISGSVTTADGRGIRNVRVSLTDQSGNVRNALTSAFGYYRFDDIEAGQTVIIGVTAKRYLFANATRVVAVQDEVADVDFTAEP